METTTSTADQPSLLLTLGEVAGHLRCTRRTVERQVAGQRLRVVRIGRSVRVERVELDRYLAWLRAGGDDG
jgi:excisionase family DNA binding protein